METNTVQPIWEDEKSCITCEGHSGVSKISKGGIVTWVINCTTKNEYVNVNGTSAKNCSDYSLNISLEELQ